jgi:hypothetical protein
MTASICRFGRVAQVRGVGSALNQFGKAFLKGLNFTLSIA